MRPTKQTATSAATSATRRGRCCSTKTGSPEAPRPRAVGSPTTEARWSVERSLVSGNHATGRWGLGGIQNYGTGLTASFPGKKAVLAVEDSTVAENEAPPGRRHLQLEPKRSQRRKRGHDHRLDDRRQQDAGRAVPRRMRAVQARACWPPTGRSTWWARSWPTTAGRSIRSTSRATAAVEERRSFPSATTSRTAPTAASNHRGPAEHLPRFQLRRTAEQRRQHRHPRPEPTSPAVDAIPAGDPVLRRHRPARHRPPAGRRLRHRRGRARPVHDRSRRRITVPGVTASSTNPSTPATIEWGMAPPSTGIGGRSQLHRPMRYESHATYAGRSGNLQRLGHLSDAYDGIEDGTVTYSNDYDGGTRSRSLSRRRSLTRL